MKLATFVPLRSCKQVLRPGLHSAGITFASFLPVFSIKSKDSHRIDDRVGGLALFRQKFDRRSRQVMKLGSWEAEKWGGCEVGRLGSREVGKLGCWEAVRRGGGEVGML